jgi:hypothetical protein
MVKIKDLIIGDRIIVSQQQDEFPIFFMEEFTVVYTGPHSVTGQYTVEIQGLNIRIELDKPEYKYFDIC